MNEKNPFGSDGETNPFQSPPEYVATPLGGSAPPPGVDELVFQGASMVRQVRAVAICIVVQGVFLGLMSLLMFGYIFLFSFMPQEELEGGMDEIMGPMKKWFAIIGVVLAILSVLHIVAGLKNYKFRGRTLGFVALGTGMLSVFTCYCAPTAIGLAIWGLIVYLNPSVARAFKLVENGTPVDNILAMAAKIRK